jgi:hypothetical protein
VNRRTAISTLALAAAPAIAGPVGLRLPGGFDPRQIAGLLLWLDASRITGLNDGDAVTTWTDLTGNGWNATQGTASAKPTYRVVGGLPVVQTDGVNDWLATTGPDLSTAAYTVVGASRWVVANTGRTFSGHGSGINWLMGHWNSSTENYFANGSWVAGPNAGASDTNWRIYAATGDFTNDSWAMYVNGVLTAGPNSNGLNGPGNFYLGSSLGAGEFGNAQFSFMFVYNRVLTGAEIQTIYDNMRGRLGL